MHWLTFFACGLESWGVSVASLLFRTLAAALLCFQGAVWDFTTIRTGTPLYDHLTHSRSENYFNSLLFITLWTFQSKRIRKSLYMQCPHTTEHRGDGTICLVLKGNDFVHKTGKFKSVKLNASEVCHRFLHSLVFSRD